MVTHVTIAPRTDTFASDADLLEETASSSDDGFGISPNAQGALLVESRLQESLIFGQDGVVGFGSPVAALSAEDRGWSPLSGVMGVFADHHHRQRLAEYLWWLYKVADPVARNAVNTMCFFLRGGGSRVIFARKEDADKWRKIGRKVKWPRIERQMIRSTVLFGECFALTWPKMGPVYEIRDGDLVERDHTFSTLEPRIRILNSFEVEDVVCLPGDPETPLAYMQKTPAGMLGHDPRDVEHVLFDDLPNCVRGHPMLLPVLQPLFFYRSFLTNRHWIHMVRSRVPLVLRLESGDTGQVAKVRAKYKKLPPPGSVWVLPKALAAEFPALNIDAGDVEADAKQYLRTVAMGISFPEYLLTADAGGANYSSQVVAQSPAMQMFEEHQSIVAESAAVIVARLMQIDEDQVTVQFPPVPANMLQLVKAYSLMRSDDVVSAKTYAEAAGLQWDGPGGEKERLESEEGFTRPTGNRLRVDPRQTEAGENPPGSGRATPPGMGEGEE